MKIMFDRSLAKGRYIFATLVAIAILLIPLVAFLAHNSILLALSSCCILDGDSMNNLMATYESYLNPSFDDVDSPERGYKLLIAYLGAFLLNGLLVSLVVSWVQNRRERWEKGDIHYGKCALGRFCIVIGGNAMVPDLVNQLLDDKNRQLDHVLVMTNLDVATLRKVFVSKLGKKEKDVVIYYGERTSEIDLQLLKLQYATEIYVIGEQLDIEQSGSHHDVKNMECIRLLANILKKNLINNDEERKTTPINKMLCRVMFEYQSSFSVFQFTDINSGISSVLDFKPFNYYETWAQNVFVCPYLNSSVEQANYLPLEGNKPITADCECTVHLIVIGMSRMGIAMGVEAAQIAHYPNFIKNKDKDLRTRITFIDSAARKEMQYLQGHYKELFAVSRWRYLEASSDSIYYNEKGYLSDGYNDDSWHDPRYDENSHSPYRDVEEYTLGKNLVDVDWEFIQGDLEMPMVQCYIRDAAQKKDVRLTIAVCITKDNASFAASLYLPDEVYEDNNSVVQVLAYQPYGDAMCQSFMNRIEMTGGSASNRINNFNQFAKLKAFGMMDKCYDISNQQKMEIAANELWKQYDRTYSGQIGGRKELRKILNDEKPLKAGKSLAANQWSNTYAAAHLWTKLRSINWDGKNSIVEDKDQEILAELEHVRWNMEQLLLGFAPLRPDEQKRLFEKFEQANCVKSPGNEIKQLDTCIKEKATINKNQFKELELWLNAWKDFDEERELLKANMSHVDICSFEILNKLDKEAIKYDKDMTSILPQIYSQITKKQ